MLSGWASEGARDDLPLNKGNAILIKEVFEVSIGGLQGGSNTRISIELCRQSVGAVTCTHAEVLGSSNMNDILTNGWCNVLFSNEQHMVSN